jgi:hypothetical protein
MEEIMRAVRAAEHAALVASFTANRELIGAAVRTVEVAQSVYVDALKATADYAHAAIGGDPIGSV